MKGTVKRLFVVSTAILSLSAALAMSARAQQQPHAAGDRSGNFQSEMTNVSPADLDASIRGQGN